MLSILDTDTVVISPGMEGEQENALPWKYLIGWKLCLLMARYVKSGSFLR